MTFVGIRANHHDVPISLGTMDTRNPLCLYMQKGAARPTSDRPPNVAASDTATASQTTRAGVGVAALRARRIGPERARSLKR